MLYSILLPILSYRGPSLAHDPVSIVNTEQI